MTDLLVKRIKTLIEKGDLATERAANFYISAGQCLKELKERKPEGITWADYLGECGIEVGRRRADELIAIADGRTTVEKVREDKAQSMAESRKRLEKSTDDSAPRGAEGGQDNEPPPWDDFPIDDTPSDDAQTIWRRGLLYRTREAGNGAMFDQGWSQYEVDRELVDAVRQAAEAWNKLAAYLKGRLSYAEKAA